MGADMRKTLLILAAALAAATAGAAHAQIKCWTEGGKRVCGDTPPAGAKVTTVRGTSASPATAAPAPAAPKDTAGKDDKAEKKGPLTPAEQEQEYRKRQAEAQKAAEKAAAEQRERAAKQGACEQARAALRTYETGQRVARTDEKGERYFLDEAQIAQERAKARQTVQRSCD